MESPVVAVPATDGQAFDWGDAGIGAAIMLGFLLARNGRGRSGPAVQEVTRRRVSLA